MRVGEHYWSASACSRRERLAGEPFMSGDHWLGQCLAHCCDQLAQRPRYKMGEWT
jgi:hypothetical protein